MQKDIYTLRELADKQIVKDGGYWPINPATSQPLCDRCMNDAVRVSFPNPRDCSFFCENCHEHDPCNPNLPIERLPGDPNAPKPTS